MTDQQTAASAPSERPGVRGSTPPMGWSTAGSAHQPRTERSPLARRLAGRALHIPATIMKRAWQVALIPIAIALEIINQAELELVSLRSTRPPTDGGPRS